MSRPILPARCHENFDIGPVIIAESLLLAQSSTALLRIVREIWPPTELGLPDTKFDISKFPSTLTNLWSLRFTVERIFLGTQNLCRLRCFFICK